MPKLRRPRYRDGRITSQDFEDLKHWLESEPDVPTGRWFKSYPKFILAGEGELPKTFLTAGMSPTGEEVN